MKALRRSSTSSPSSSSSASSTSAASSSSPPPSSWIQLRSLRIAASSSTNSSILCAATCSSNQLPFASAERRGIKSPWSKRRRKHPLSRQQWCCLFSANGKLRDGGSTLLKRVRSRGVEPSLRAEVWPFLLGVYDLNSTEAERSAVKMKKRKDYEKLRMQCLKLSIFKGTTVDSIDEGSNVGCPSLIDGHLSPCFNDSGLCSPVTPEEPILEESVTDQHPILSSTFNNILKEDSNEYGHGDEYAAESESSDSEFSDEEYLEGSPVLSVMDRSGESEPKFSKSASVKVNRCHDVRYSEDFISWQRIIRLDAIRANPEWVLYSSNQAAVSDEKAFEYAETVGLKDYDNLQACMIYHAARLVAVLEAYAVYDPDIGYCQGMSDLLSPIVAVMEDNFEAFWCFVGFMRKARNNYRLDEVGIRRQLKIVSKIIKHKDSHLYKHLEKLQAADCFFVYRMVVVLFRRELTFEQTVCLWEVMWADQAAIRAGIGRSTWARIRYRAPPTDDLLLYAIAACVLQRRKLIIEKYSSMDEILRECNSIDGQLDIWKLLDDAHDLVINCHDKI